MSQHPKEVPKLGVKPGSLERNSFWLVHAMASLVLYLLHCSLSSAWKRTVVIPRPLDSPAAQPGRGQPSGWHLQQQT